MLAAMQAQSAVDFQLRIAFHGQSTQQVVRGKNRVRKAVGLQYAFVHLPVTRTVSSFARFYIDRDLTACYSRGRVETHGPAFDLETSMHGMKQRPQSKSNGGLGGVDFDLDRAGRENRI